MDEDGQRSKNRLHALTRWCCAREPRRASLRIVCGQDGAFTAVSA